MSDDTSMADRLYPSSSAAAAPATPAAPSASPTSLAERLFAPDPVRREDAEAGADVKANRDADPARRLFSAQGMYQDVLPDDVLPGLDVVSAREVAADLKADPADVTQFVTLMRSLPTVTEETQAGWRAESKDLGIADADIARARDYVKADPRLHRLLDETGLGDHPRVVSRIVELARAAQLRRLGRA